MLWKLKNFERTKKLASDLFKAEDRGVLNHPTFWEFLGLVFLSISFVTISSRDIQTLLVNLLCF